MELKSGQLVPVPLKTVALSTLSEHLQENAGNRITTALYHGLMFAVDQALTQAEQAAAQSAAPPAEPR